MSKKYIEIFDSTLRDGAQGEDISFSLEDKIKVAIALLYPFSQSLSFG